MTPLSKSQVHKQKTGIPGPAFRRAEYRGMTETGQTGMTVRSARSALTEKPKRPASMLPAFDNLITAFTPPARP